MAPAAEMCSTWRMSTATLRDENERLKALLAQTQAALSEHQAALATSEEARRRLEVILGELRREKFGAKSEKLRPDQYHLPLEDVEIAQGVLDAAQEKAAAIIRGRSRAGSDQDRHRNRGYLPPFAAGGAGHRACEHVLSVRLRRHDEDRRGYQQTP